jgi:antitoxin component of RelBE/YafQ-DinJ toxin-antitoxin module
MANTEVIGMLRKLLETMDKESAFKNSTTQYYLIQILYSNHILPTHVDEYLKIRSIECFGKLYPLARNMRMSLRRIAENGGLPLKYSFLNETLLEQIDILEDMMLNADEHEIPLEKFNSINQFILSKTEEILQNLKEGSLEPKGTDYDKEVVTWWENRQICLSR